MIIKRNIRDLATLALRDKAMTNAVLRACKHSSNARTQALLQLKNAQEVSKAAIKAREKTAERLNELVQKLVSRLEERGICVHLASDAKQACEIVSGLIEKVFGEKATVTIVKAKTMVGEEAGLSDYLRDRGFQVTETDLGEFIVQLRGERPSHILAPALHLSRADIGRLFSERLGMGYSEDPSQITRFARGFLRNRFLEAKVGIIGVNIAVASTGTLITLSNEGNARFCATLPELVIAFTSIDKVVENSDDAAALLRILPRNATGQIATTYVTLLGGQFPPGTPFAAQQMHVVLLDNGRSRWLSDAEIRPVLRCIRCGACLNICPVYRTIGGHAYGTIYPGPMGIMWTGVLAQPDLGDLPFACTLCNECRVVCPAGIEIPKIILTLRARTRKSLWKKLIMMLTHWFFSGRRRLQGFGRLIAFASRRFSRLSRVFARLLGWTTAEPLPTPAAHSFRVVWEKGLISLPSTRIAKSPKLLDEPEPAPASLETQEDLLEMFIRQFTLASGEVIEAKDIMSAMLKLKEITSPSVVIWSGGNLAKGAATVLEELGIEVFEEGSVNREKAACADLGLSDCVGLVAETGSVLLAHPPSRATSLLPDTHAILATPGQLLPTLEFAFSLTEKLSHPSYTLVTGPSRTADIEKTLIMGMHGPRRVILCLLTGS